MDNISMILNWINPLAIIILLEGVLIIKEKYTPKIAGEKLKGIALKRWRRTRLIADIISFIALYLETTYYNLKPNGIFGGITSFGGLALIIFGSIILVKNNKSKLGKICSVM